MLWFSSILLLFGAAHAIFDQVSLVTVDQFPFAAQFDWALGMGFLPLFFKNQNGCNMKLLTTKVPIPVSGSGTTRTLKVDNLSGGVAMQCASIGLELNVYAIRFRVTTADNTIQCYLFEAEGSCDSLQVLGSALDRNSEKESLWYRSTYEEVSGGAYYWSLYYFNPQRVNYVNNMISPFADPHFTDPLYTTGVVGYPRGTTEATPAVKNMRRAFFTAIRLLFGTVASNQNAFGYFQPLVSEYTTFDMFDKATRFYVTTDNFLSCFMHCEKLDACTGVQFFTRFVETSASRHSPVGCGMYFASYENSFELTRTSGTVTFQAETSIFTQDFETATGHSSRTRLFIKPTYLGFFMALPVEPTQNGHTVGFLKKPQSQCSAYYGNSYLFCKGLLPRRGSGGCSSNQYIALKASAFNDQICLPQTSCTLLVEYECAPPTPTSARKCCTVRPECYFAEIAGPTYSADRQCADDLAPDKWFDTTELVIKDRTVCDSEQVILNTPTPITDNLCGYIDVAECAAWEYSQTIEIDGITRAICLNRTECAQYLVAPNTTFPGWCASNSVVSARVQRNVEDYFWGFIALLIVSLLAFFYVTVHASLVIARWCNPEVAAGKKGLGLARRLLSRKAAEDIEETTAKKGFGFARRLLSRNNAEDIEMKTGKLAKNVVKYTRGGKKSKAKQSDQSGAESNEEEDNEGQSAGEEETSFSSAIDTEGLSKTVSALRHKVEEAAQKAAHDATETVKHHTHSGHSSHHHHHHSGSGDRAPSSLANFLQKKMSKKEKGNSSQSNLSRASGVSIFGLDKLK